MVMPGNDRDQVPGPDGDVDDADGQQQAAPAGQLAVMALHGFELVFQLGAESACISQGVMV